MFKQEPVQLSNFMFDKIEINTNLNYTDRDDANRIRGGRVNVSRAFFKPKSTDSQGKDQPRSFLMMMTVKIENDESLPPAITGTLTLRALFMIHETDELEVTDEMALDYISTKGSDAAYSIINGLIHQLTPSVSIVEKSYILPAITFERSDEIEFNELEA